MRAISAKSVGVAPYLQRRRCERSFGLEVRARGTAGSTLLHVLLPRVPKHLRRARCIRNTTGNLHHLHCSPTRVGPILKETLQAASEHLLEADHHDTIRYSMADHIPCHLQSS